MPNPRRRPAVNSGPPAPSLAPSSSQLSTTIQSRHPPSPSPQTNTNPLLESHPTASPSPPSLLSSDDESVALDDDAGAEYAASDLLIHNWKKISKDLPPRADAKRCRRHLNDLGPHAGFKKLLYILCKEHKHAKRRRQFMNLKSFVFDVLLPDKDLVSDAEISRFLMARGTQVLTESVKEEMRTIARHRSMREIVSDTCTLEQSPLLPHNQIQESAPMLLNLLRHIKTNDDETRSAKPRYESQRESFLICYLLNLRYPRKCAGFSTSTGVFLHSAGTSRKGLDVLYRLGIVSEYKSILKAQNKFMEERQRQVRLMGCNPRVNITYDNFDLGRSVNDERYGDHKEHFSTTTAMINEGVIIPDNGLPQSDFRSKQPLRVEDVLTAGVLQVTVIKSFWRYTVLRALFTVFAENLKPKEVELGLLAPRPTIDVLQPTLAAAQTYEQRHQPITPLIINESTVPNTIKILEDITQNQLQMDTASPFFKDHIMLVHGDQKTIGLLRQAQRQRGSDDTPYDRLQWVHPVMGLWHFKYNFLAILHDLYWQKDKESSRATLHASAAFLNRKRLEDPRGDFRALEQLVLHSFQARIVAMFVDVVQESHSRRTRDRNLIEEQVKDWINNSHARHIMNTIDDLIAKITLCRTPAQEEAGFDTEYEDHRIFLQNTMPYLMTKIAIKYGDIGLLRIALAQACVLYQGTSHSRYARELLYTFRSVAGSTASQQFQRAVLANALVNDRGLPDTFFEKDRKLEHWNKMVTIWHKHHSSSSIPVPELLKKALLLAPQTSVLARKYLDFLGVRSNTFHALKSASEDVKNLAMHLWTERSVRDEQGRFQRKGEQFSDPMRDGIQALSSRISAVNNIIISGAAAVYDPDPNEDMEHEGSLLNSRPILQADDGELGIEFLSDTDSMVYNSQADSDQDSVASLGSYYST